jgi:predicted membrane protein
MSFNEKGLSQLPSPVKIFIITYEVLIAAGLLLAFWIVLESPILRGGGDAENQIKTLEEAGLADEAKQARAAQLYANLKLAHIHHLGHMFMVFSVAGIYAFTRGKNSIKTQLIIWTTIVTLIHTIAFLISSRILLIVFGSAYVILVAYMLLIILIDCYRPVRQ